MRPLEELINEADSGLPFVIEAAGKIAGRCVVHPAVSAEQGGEMLHRTQVTTRSPMGAMVYHTGGITVLDGWLRILGSGCEAIPRSLPAWNEGRAEGFLLVADDAFGGFFAVDGGALGVGPGKMCYFAPETLRWESMDCGYSQFLAWACSDFRGFYDSLAFPGCEQVISNLKPDRCLFFYPPLWSQPRATTTDRSVPVQESWGFQMEVAAQLDGPSA